MVAPPEVSQGMDELHVDGRSLASGMFVNEDFKIDAYEVANVSRGAKHTTSFSVLGAAKSDAESGYSFDFKSAGQVAHGECLVEIGQKGLGLNGITLSKQVAKIGCACGTGAAPVASLVMSAETGGNGYGGVLKARAGTYQVKAIYEREGSISDGNPAGYRVDGPNLVAAVDVLGGGRVWVRKEVAKEPRSDLACIMAGLLLYKPPKD